MLYVVDPLQAILDLLGVDGAYRHVGAVELPFLEKGAYLRGGDEVARRRALEHVHVYAAADLAGCHAVCPEEREHQVADQDQRQHTAYDGGF